MLASVITHTFALQRLLCGRELETAEYSLEIESQTIARLKAENAQLSDENAQLRADLRTLKANSHRTQLVLHLRKVRQSVVQHLLLYNCSLEAATTGNRTPHWRRP